MQMLNLFTYDKTRFNFTQDPVWIELAVAEVQGNDRGSVDAAISNADMTPNAATKSRPVLQTAEVLSYRLKLLYVNIYRADIQIQWSRVSEKYRVQ